jgi:hypothetical protein
MSLFVNLKLARARQNDLLRGATLWARFATSADGPDERQALSVWRRWRESRTHNAGLDPASRRTRIDRAQAIANHAGSLASVPYDTPTLATSSPNPYHLTRR